MRTLLSLFCYGAFDLVLISMFGYGQLHPFRVPKSARDCGLTENAFNDAPDVVFCFPCFGGHVTDGLRVAVQVTGCKRADQVVFVRRDLCGYVFAGGIVQTVRVCIRGQVHLVQEIEAPHVTDKIMVHWFDSYHLA